MKGDLSDNMPTAYAFDKEFKVVNVFFSDIFIALLFITAWSSSRASLFECAQLSDIRCRIKQATSRKLI
jgi:hypothetical protein